MLNTLVHMSLSPLEFVVRAGAVFLFVLILLRLSGKRQVGQMSATDLVAIMLISNAVQNSMNGGDNSLTGGLILAVVLIAMSWSISVLSYRSKKFRDLFEGVPTLLIHKGKVVEANLKKELISLADLRILLRKQGVQHIHDVKTAILESDGSLSVAHVGDAPVELVPNEDSLDFSG
ncbi:MAG: YetF domain-containing protein [Bdellovibrionota bacterium]